MRYIIRLSYNGSSFCGWQLQKNAPSIQEELQHALSTVFQEKVRITGAGRTDTGVNAINYIAHFDLPDGCAFNTEKALYKLNAILPGTIAIHSLSQADEGLHARFSAISREYHYFVHRNKDPFIGNYSYYCRYPIDMEKMNEAAVLLKGTRDFSCFEKTGGNNATSICTVYDAGWHIYSPAHVSLLGYPSEDGDYIVFRIRADRFLRNMVRAIAGSLIDVGRGKRTVEWFRSLIETGTRSDAGESVPGKALFFNDVRYPEVKNIP